MVEYNIRTFVFIKLHPTKYAPYFYLLNDYFFQLFPPLTLAITIETSPHEGCSQASNAFYLALTLINLYEQHKGESSTLNDPFLGHIIMQMPGKSRVCFVCIWVCKFILHLFIVLGCVKEIVF